MNTLQQTTINEIFNISTTEDKNEETAVKNKFNNVTFFDGTNAEFLPEDFSIEDIVKPDGIFTIDDIVELKDVKYDSIEIMYIHNFRGGLETTAIVFVNSKTKNQFITFNSDKTTIYSLEYNCDIDDVDLNEY